MFRFAAEHLWYLYAVVPGAAALLWFASRRRKQALESLGDRGLMARLTDSVSIGRRRFQGATLVAALALVVTGLLRPQFGSRLETVEREGQDIVVALDVSNSMLAEDIAPNRLERAKASLRGFMRSLRGDRIGLVAFAGEAFVQMPLTVDYGAAAMFLAAMDPDVSSVPGTNLGAALETALDAFEREQGEHRVIILITDGEDHVGAIEEQVERARDTGVPIHAVGIGSLEGVPIPDFDTNGRRIGFHRDGSGNVVTTRLDEATLRLISRETGGRYVRLATGSALDVLAEQIAAEQGRSFESQQVTQFEEQYQVFVGAALLLLLANSFTPDRRRTPSEWRGRF